MNQESLICKEAGEVHLVEKGFRRVIGSVAAIDALYKSFSDVGCIHKVRDSVKAVAC
jgi:hypothetical protein